MHLPVLGLHEPCMLHDSGPKHDVCTVQFTPVHPRMHCPHANAGSKFGSHVHAPADELVGLTPHCPRRVHGADADGPGHGIVQFAPVNPGSHAVQFDASEKPGLHEHVPRSEHCAPRAPPQLVATVHETLHVEPYHPAAQSVHVGPPKRSSHTHWPVCAEHEPCDPQF